MSEPTLTTWQVRRAFALEVDEIGHLTVDEHQAIEFDRWLAEHDAEKRAEWEAEQGEMEWEYGLLNPEAPGGGKLQGGAHLISDNREHIERQQRRGHPVIQAVKRRKAGPWVPVEQEPDQTTNHVGSHDADR